MSAHLHRTESASPNQLVLAQIYNLTVPQGYTFVRPHERGHKKVQVIYRSRSALQSLYEMDVRSPRGMSQPLWFQFERNMAQLMKTMGYEVQHKAASRNGDHGVDVYATKLHKDRIENWVIQRKCYNPRHKVGPDIVRELIGSLSSYGEDTMGMIVTTSTYTAGAIEKVNEVGIQLINGKHFAQLITRDS